MRGLGQSELMARLCEEMRRPPFHGWLLPRAVAVDGDQKVVEIEVDFRRELGFSRDADFYHGGVLSALADIAGHAAVAVWHGAPAPTIDLRIDYLRVAPGETLRAKGLLRKLGRAISTADVELFVGQRLVAVARGTYSTLQEPRP
ncbi:PaaI family thioesterase [Amorphus sp. 3PC139-8]|uniref:PaaI family thioesterase n=1 Tax=Amorphus sp. 3PC139-8 TaxID=2735676 RepID=UPI00345C83B1